MRRVSSRQRLVSWDAFDADVIFSSDNESSAGEEEETGGASSILEYATAREASFRSVMDVEESDDAHAFGPATASPQSGNGGGTVVSNDDRNANTAVNVRRKRDRNAFRDALGRTNKASVGRPTATTNAATSARAVPSLIPSYSWEIAGSASHVSSLTSPSSVSSLESMSTTASDSDFPPTAWTFDDLMGDVHLAVISFLDLSSIRNMMAVNHRYRQLMLTEDASTSIWMEHCQRRWHLSKSRAAAPTLVDSYHIPVAASLGGSLQEEPQRASPHVNLPLLLSMTPDDLPTAVDDGLAKSRGSVRHWRMREQQAGPHSTASSASSNSQILFYNDEATGRPLVRYNGVVGSGDRCIRSNHCLPRPTQQKEEPTNGRRRGGWAGSLGSAVQGDHFDGHNRQLQRCNRLYDMFSLGANRLVGRGGGARTSSSSSSSGTSSPSQRRPWKPFVMPFVDSSNNNNKEAINVTPRLVAYYEVSILGKPEEGNEEDVDDRDGPMHAAIPGTASRTNDCVAVGVATESFPVHSRMPGWDLQSFGYHGDDGGIFHSSGGMVKQYGPTFGAGDTVGCGVDYVERGIFYTLNGKFLGYAWTGVAEELLANDLFPVVGLDTNCPLHLNFGTNGGGAFQFDLASFLMKHEKIVAPLYRLSPLDEGDDGALGSSRHSSSSRSKDNDSSRSNGSRRGLFPRGMSASSGVSSSKNSSSSRRSRHLSRRGAYDRT